MATKKVTKKVKIEEPGEKVGNGKLAEPIEITPVPDEAPDLMVRRKLKGY